MFGRALRVRLDNRAGINHEHNGPGCPKLAHGQRGNNRHHSQHVQTDVAFFNVGNHADERIDNGDEHKPGHHPHTRVLETLFTQNNEHEQHRERNEQHGHVLHGLPHALQLSVLHLCSLQVY